MPLMHELLLPEILCLSAQLLFTLATIRRIINNQNEFPVKQLGPLSTVFCCFCFLVANTLSLVGRLVVDHNLFPSACKMYDSNLMLVLGVLFNMARELPFALFALKTLRVSLCFWPRFNKINVQKLNKCFVSLMKNQVYLIYICLFYVCIVNILAASGNGVTSQAADLSYQYFCPKESSVTDIMVSAIRVLTLGFVFYLSTMTYDELDFTKFLLLLFFTSNLSIVPHIILDVLDMQYQNISTRAPIYYCAYIIELCNTCLVMYYSGIYKRLGQLPLQGVLQSWEAFHNVQICIKVLLEYAIDKDEKIKSPTKINERCLRSFEFLDELVKELVIDPDLDKRKYLAAVQAIFENNPYIRQKFQQDLTRYIGQCKDGTLKVDVIKKMEKCLSNYCESNLFVVWKQTKSYKFLKQEMINNGDINEKLSLFEIPFS